MRDKGHVKTEFLNSNERRNSKTYYYLRIIKNHKEIALLVHNWSYRQHLRYNIKNCDPNANIYWARAYDDWKELERKINRMNSIRRRSDVGPNLSQISSRSAR